MGETLTDTLNEFDSDGSSDDDNILDSIETTTSVQTHRPGKTRVNGRKYAGDEQEEQFLSMEEKRVLREGVDELGESSESEWNSEDDKPNSEDEAFVVDDDEAVEEYGSSCDESGDSAEDDEEIARVGKMLLEEEEKEERQNDDGDSDDDGEGRRRKSKGRKRKRLVRYDDEMLVQRDILEQQIMNRKIKKQRSNSLGRMSASMEIATEEELKTVAKRPTTEYIMVLKLTEELARNELEEGAPVLRMNSLVKILDKMPKSDYGALWVNSVLYINGFTRKKHDALKSNARKTMEEQKKEEDVRKMFAIKRISGVTCIHVSAGVHMAKALLKKCLNLDVQTRLNALDMCGFKQVTQKETAKSIAQRVADDFATYLLCDPAKRALECDAPAPDPLCTTAPLDPKSPLWFLSNYALVPIVTSRTEYRRECCFLRENTQKRLKRVSYDLYAVGDYLPKVVGNLTVSSSLAPLFEAVMAVRYPIHHTIVWMAGSLKAYKASVETEKAKGPEISAEILDILFKGESKASKLFPLSKSLYSNISSCLDTAFHFVCKKFDIQESMFYQFDFLKHWANAKKLKLKFSRKNNNKLTNVNEKHARDKLLHTFVSAHREYFSRAFQL